MTKRRWLKSMIKTAQADTTALPWARGSRRAGWKDATKQRARAA